MALLGSFLLDSLGALLLLLFIGYIFATAQYTYFKKRGIPYVRPWPIVGNFGSVLTGKNTFNRAVVPLYEKLKKHRFGGIFTGFSPVVMVCDPELVKVVLTKDFSSLADHGMPFDEDNDPMSANLFNMPGVRWKNMRSKLSPVFTSGKLKQMLPLMSECADELSSVLREFAKKGEVVDMRDYLIRYTTDTIGTCAFGISCNSIRNPKSEFYGMSQKFFKPSLLLSIRFMILNNSKFIAKLIPFKVLFPDVHEFFINLMSETINYRKTNNVERNDLVQQMMQVQKNDEGKTRESHPDDVIFTNTVIAAQAFLFFVAGLDGIANSVGFALHHLSVDPRIQDDLADEIHSVIRQHDGKITYEGLKEMKLVEMVVSEVLRMYTPAGMLFREVTASSYTIPGSDFTLKKGEKITIPVYGLHYDPEIYPDPERFDPYRFTEEEISKRPQFTFMPFGEGPRVCIASRMALLEIKLCLASIIKDFKFSVCPKTDITMKLKTHTFSVAPDKGFYLKIEERNM